MHSRWIPLFVGAAVSLHVGCGGGGDGASSDDAGTDSTMDATSDAPTTDADAAPHDGTTHDGASDATVDGAADGAHETGSDAASDGEASIDAGPTDLLATGVTANGFWSFGSTVYFDGKDATHGDELWSTDLTAAGTALLFDACPGACDGYPMNVVQVNGHVLFGARTFDGDFREVFAIQPSGAPTLLKTGADFSGSRTDVLGSRLLFAEGGSLWGTDGTSAGTTPSLVTFGGEFPEDVTAIGARALVVVAQTASSPTGINYDLYSTDGTTAGTLALEHGIGVTSRFVELVAGGKGFVVNSGGGTSFLTITDGTFAGTKDLVGGDFRDLGAFAALPSGTVVFEGTPSTATTPALWASDGTTATQIFGEGPDLETAVMGPAAYFVTWSGDFVRTDGTTAGTSVVSSFAPKKLYMIGAAGSYVYFFVGAKGSLPELWKSDGTVAGTTLVKALPICAPASCVAGYDFIAWASAVGGRIVLLASVTSPLTRHLWVSDGTDVNTKVLSDSVQGNFLALPGGAVFGTTANEVRYETY